MRYLDKRVDIICRELKKLSLKNVHSIKEWKYKKGFYLYPEQADQASGEWEDYDYETMHWYGPDAHCWFRCQVEVPREFDGKNLWIQILPELGMTRDSTKNPQFMLFLNGEVLQGMDINHSEVKLLEQASAGESLQIDVLAYSGLDFKEFNFVARFQELDSAIAGLYYDLWVPLQSFSRMAEENKNRIDLTTVLNETVNFLDLRNPYSEEFYTSVKSAREYIARELYQKMGGNEEIIASCIGHTHIDVAWLWTVNQTREKAVRSFSTVLKLMSEYPDYKFMSSQPQLYEFVKERYPEIYEQIKERVKEGRWEPEGGMWVEADCNLSSGESLIRQFLYGKRFFREEFGVDNKILWLPDVFGYSGALPQIMKGCGIEYFMTTKLAWNQMNEIPNDTMIWKGIDGSEIFTHMITTVDIGQDIKNFFTTYNGRLHPDSIMGGWERYQNKNINNDILISYGFGDGGGGPTREMLETSARMEKGIRGIPKVRQVFSRQYFDELKERVSGNERLNTWEGEFYFEYHRGTYTSMGRNKRDNRKCELMMMDLELLSVLAERLKGIDYPQKKIEQLWKTIMINQFHDILPGSSIHEVYEVTDEEYRALKAEMSAMIGSLLNELSEDADCFSVFNTLGIKADNLVTIPDQYLSGTTLAGLSDLRGRRFPVQKTEDGFIARVTGIPAFGSLELKPETLEENANPFIIEDYSVETDFYQFVLDENGLIASFYDKQEDREILQAGKKGNILRMYEDKPMAHNNWDIDIYYSEKFWDISNLDEMKFIEKGPVRTTLYLRRSFSKSIIEQKICFYADTARIDFETKLDWKDSQHILKACFPVDIHSDEASFDIQFGNVKRKVHENTSWDEARFESCAHKWIDYSEGHYGVALLNDCKYGHSIKNSEMALTLVKSGTHPNPVADQEIHYITYSLYPHSGNLAESDTVKEAEELNRTPYLVKGRMPESSFCCIDKENIRIETLKKAEDNRGMIVRMYENQNARTKAVLQLPEGSSRLVECNMLEEDIKEIEVREGKASILVKPYEVKTYRVV